MAKEFGATVPLPGMGGGQLFNLDSLPALPNGPNPTSGVKFTGKPPDGNTGAWLATLSAPRKRDERTNADEFALLVASYNQKFGTTLPVNSMDPNWFNKGPQFVAFQNAFGRTATGRVHAYLCQAGKGHCPDPGIFKQIENAISSIPIVGDIVHIAGEAVAAPFNLVSSIASGERLDHALVGALKDQVKIVKDVAPYAQTVVSLVPGIGTGISAAIGAGAALAEGKSIDEAAKAAIKGALPGGPLAAAGFDAAVKVASGENVGKAALESARNLVPAGPAQKAFDIGVAVATGEKLQNAVAKGLTSLAPEALQTVIGVGQKAIESTPGLSSVVHGLSAEATRGAQLAAGLLSHSGVNEKALTAFRSKLTNTAKQGFDAALNAQAHHLPWLSNVTGTPVKAPAPHAVEPKVAPHAAEPPKVAPHAAEPPKAAPHAAEPSRSVPVPHGAAPQSIQAPQAAVAPGQAAAAQSAVPSSAAPRGGIGPYPSPWPTQVGTHGLDAPPHPHLPPGHHEGHPLTRGGPRWGGGAPWWGIPYTPDAVTVQTTCRTWGDPIELPPPMVAAARAALGASQGRPTAVRGPDGVLYLFSFERGAITARPCAAVAMS